MTDCTQTSHVIRLPPHLGILLTAEVLLFLCGSVHNNDIIIVNGLCTDLKVVLVNFLTS